MNILKTAIESIYTQCSGCGIWVLLRWKLLNSFLHVHCKCTLYSIILLFINILFVFQLCFKFVKSSQEHTNILFQHDSNSVATHVEMFPVSAERGWVSPRYAQIAQTVQYSSALLCSNIHIPQTKGSPINLKD